MTPDDETTNWARLPPLQVYLGIELVEAKDGQSLMRLPWREEICNRKGDVHGGTIASLVDLSMGLAIRSTREDIKGISTISMTVNFVAPARGELKAKAQVVKSGRTTAFVEAKVEDSNGEVVAAAVGTFRMMLKKD